MEFQKKKKIQWNEKNYNYRTTPTWGGLDDVTNLIATIDEKIFKTHTNEEQQSLRKDISHLECKHYGKYDIDVDLHFFEKGKKINTSFERAYELSNQPHIMDNPSLYNMRRNLNKEQASIEKDILTKKKKRN